MSSVESVAFEFEFEFEFAWGEEKTVASLPVSQISKWVDVGAVLMVSRRPAMKEASTEIKKSTSRGRVSFINGSRNPCM